ncbi:tunicamycin resistance protein [Streptomyces sp. SID7499]|uniref:Tunicamycin resistance protein n=1 Tax=Streptomyces sp. SID7499 TaxID=2706086 RepID=A0A6G3X8N3_9ACTN|nr:tunicamycin resistance protein [Streptomyces sp. SID7499]
MTRTEKPLLVWINGPFGAGKSTVTDELSRAAGEVIVFDPEEVGFHLRTWVPLPASGDFQDLACWRDVVGQTCAAFARHYPSRLLLVPMTVVNDDYRQEIFDILRKSTDQVLHVWLSVTRQTLADRITHQVIWPDDPERDAEVRAWRLAQIDGAMTAESRLGADTVVLPTDDTRPRQLAERILAEAARRTGKA